MFRNRVLGCIGGCFRRGDNVGIPGELELPARIKISLCSVCHEVVEIAANLPKGLMGTGLTREQLAGVEVLVKQLNQRRRFCRCIPHGWEHDAVEVK